MYVCKCTMVGYDLIKYDGSTSTCFHLSNKDHFLDLLERVYALVLYPLIFN